MGVPKCAVSVIVLIYNPDVHKLESTLLSIIGQKNVDFEIVLSDDGSKESIEEGVKAFFGKHNFSKYRFIRSVENTGTVKNYLRGLYASNGIYIFGTSPGDMLYDETVLADFYDFAVNQKAKICFGRAAYYNMQGINLNIIEGVPNLPPYPQLFRADQSRKTEKTAIFFGSIILGATFFRERESTIHYLNEIKDYVKFAEDNTSAILAELSGERITYFDRLVIWYEYGTGISTTASSKWHNILENEYDSFYKYIKEKYPRDRILDAAIVDRFSKGKFESKVRRVIKHPFIALEIVRIKRNKKLFVSCTDAGIEHLKYYLKIKEE